MRQTAPCALVNRLRLPRMALITTPSVSPGNTPIRCQTCPMRGKMFITGHRAARESQYCHSPPITYLHRISTKSSSGAPLMETQHIDINQYTVRELGDIAESRGLTLLDLLTL